MLTHRKNQNITSWYRHWKISAGSTSVSVLMIWRILKSTKKTWTLDFMDQRAAFIGKYLFFHVQQTFWKHKKSVLSWWKGLYQLCRSSKMVCSSWSDQLGRYSVCWKNTADLSGITACFKPDRLWRKFVVPKIRRSWDTEILLQIV